MSFLKKFDKEYYSVLNGNPSPKKKESYPNIFQRADAFRLIFSELENKKKESFNIIETGTIRKIGNWNDGQSSYLFQEFLKINAGSLRSVDISESTCKIARSILDSNICTITCSDSVKFLSSIDLNNIDLFFLDSYDVDWNDCGPSANHHLQEFKTIEKNLKPGTIVAIDDNLIIKNKRTGKGRDIYEYLQSKNIFPIYDGYIIIYIWR